MGAQLPPTALTGSAKAGAADARMLPCPDWPALLAVSCSALLGGMPPERDPRMKLSIELTDAENTRLREAAEHLGVEPEALARAAVADLLGNEDEDFREAAKHVLRKNEELYRRLA